MIKLFIRSLQSAIFIPILDLTNKIGFANQLIQDTGGLFDGDPIVLPIPNDAPPEIPRIILKNKSESYSLNISQNRIDLFFNEKSLKNNLPTRELSDVNQEFLDKTNLIIRSILKTSPTRVARLGFIVTLQGKIADKATAFVNKLYIKQRKSFENLYDVNLGLLKKEKVDRLDSNIWFRVNPLRKQGDPSDNKIVTVQFDINTKSEELLNLSLENINKYFKEAAEYINKNVISYFD